MNNALPADASSSAGLVVSGTFQAGRLVEVVELPDHPWFVASQFHPEFKSRPTRPAPLFRDFVGAGRAARGASRGAAASRPRGTPPTTRFQRNAETARVCAGLDESATFVPPGPRIGRDHHLGLGRPRPLPRARRHSEPVRGGGGGRRAVVRSYLARPRAEADEDDDAGNLLARLEPAERNGGSSIFLCAHLDTVPPCGPIEPVVGEDGFVRNEGGTILGADNKATVAVLLEAARLLLSEGRPHAGVELLFTVQEEVGLEGAKDFDHTRLQSKLGFVYDCSGPVGEIVARAPYGKTIDVVFKGRCAHAGHRPGGRAARPSPPPRGPSPTSGSAGSTRRRPPTWA